MSYTPNKAIVPGHTLARILEREEMTQKNLCDRTGLSEKHLSQIINGEASITIETALLFENALGGSASFWINLEKNYQETKSRLERASLLKNEASLVKQFPYAELAERKYVPLTRNLEERVDNLWKFFAVNSLNFVQKVQPVAYRKRAGKTNKDGAIAAWLRCGELDARENKVGVFSESKLKSSLPQLRSLSMKEPGEYSVEARRILAESGVSLVYVEHFDGTGVSGAARWVGDTPLIQLSLLGAYADKFWFNLFHEIGHLVLHGKKGQFIEFTKPLVDDKEKEANEFAANSLIPKEDYAPFLEANDFSRQAVQTFAKKLDINPGIVEGRLKYDQKLRWDKSLGFQTKLVFKKTVAA